MLKFIEQLRNFNSFRTPPPAAPPLSALCAAEEDIARLPTSQFSQLSTPQANRTSSLLFPLLALYLDNTGSASEKQIEQVLCFSLGLHYIWIIQAAPRKSKSNKFFAFLSACTIFVL